MSLEDFHTKALRLVTQAGYEGDAKNKVLRDNIISGLTSDKIRAKIVKEGHEVTLNQVMEIARLELSYGDSKAGSLHTAAFGENARDCQSELHPVWKVNQI